MEQWTCPNDRQLALRAKLGTGWSIHSSKASSYHRLDALSAEEQDKILSVIQRSELIDAAEQERIGRLVERVENMKKQALGDGGSRCILCADQFGLLAATPTTCDDCKKMVCQKCCVDTQDAHGKTMWLCKICSENRELWKRSGAWFFKGLPKYVMPTSIKRSTNSTRYNQYVSIKRVDSGSSRNSNSSTQNNRSYRSWAAESTNNNSDVYSSSDEDGISLSKYRNHRKNVKNPSDYDDISVSSMQSSNLSNRLYVSRSQQGSRTSLSSVGLCGGPAGHASATESGREEDSAECDQDSAGISKGFDTVDKTGDGLSSQSDNTNSETRALPVNQKISRAFHKVSREIKRKKIPGESDLGELEFTLLYSSSEYTLTCNIICAKNLLSMDSNGLSDPYVKLNLLPSRKKSFLKKTRVIEKSLNPEWNEELVYYGIQSEDLSKTLLLSVLDKDTLGHDYMGEYRLPLSTLKPNFKHSYSVILERPLSLPLALENDADKNFSILDRGRIQITLHYVTKYHQFCIKILRCANLASMDSNGYSDPYVKIYLKPDPNKKTKRKTTTKRRTLNPVYNEEFSYEITLPELTKRTLNITVWDKDLTSSDFIGSLSISINSRGERLKHWFDCIKNPDKAYTQWHILSSRASNDSSK